MRQGAFLIQILRTDSVSPFFIERKVYKMTVLRLLTSDQHLVAAHRVKVAAGDINSLILHVDFDAVWDEFIVRKALFENDSVKCDTQDILLVGNECIVPPEVVSAAGVVSISVTGYTADGTAKKTSTIVKMKVHESLTDATTTIEPTMDLYMQYLAALKEHADPVLNAMMNEVKGYKTEMFEKLEPTTLWENPDTSVGFAAQTVALNSSATEFRRFHIIFKEYINEDSFIECVCTEIDKTHSVTYTEINNSGTSGNACYNRRFNIKSNGTVEFTRCDNPGQSNTADNIESENKNLIPCKIIGYQY